MIINIANVNKIIKYVGVRTYYLVKCGPGSSVGIATELRAGQSKDRIPVGTRFSARRDRPWDPLSLL